MYTRGRTGWAKHADFMILDVLCLNAAFLLAYSLRFRSGNPYGDELYREIIIVLSIIELAATSMLNNLNHVLQRGFMDELINVILLSFVTVMGITLYAFSVHSAGIISRLLIFYTAIFFILIDYPARIILKHLITWFRSVPIGFSSEKKPLFVLTDSRNIGKIAEELKKDNTTGYELKAVSLTDYYDDVKVYEPGVNIQKEVFDLNDCEIISYVSAKDYICRNWIDEVLIYLPDNASQPRDFLDACMEMGLTVHQILNFQKVEKNKHFIETIAGHTVLTTAFNYVAPYQAVIKRLFDILGSLIGCIFTVLLTLILGPIIKVKSPGPIFFRQERIGKNGKHFQFYKFRSMVMNADEMKQDLMDQNRVEDGLMFKMDDDPRIIPGIGNFIRKTSLDEFPQFFNVLKGDMSLVGTRPPTVDEWEKYAYHHRARMAIRPGITGMWQVSGRSQITDFEEVVKLDTWYITNWRLSLDLKILIKTVTALVQRKGAM